MKLVKWKAQLENIEQGQTKVTCNFCRFTTDIRDTKTLGMSVEVDALYKRGMLLVEFSDWSAAIEVFDQALNLAPDNANLYVGRLLAELKLPKMSRLAHHRADLNRLPSFRKATRFATPELRQELEDYNEIIQKRLAMMAQEREEQVARRVESYEKAESERLKREAEEAERIKKLAAEHEEMRRRNRPKRIIRNIIVIIAIIGLAVFFLT